MKSVTTYKPHTSPFWGNELKKLITFVIKHVEAETLRWLFLGGLPLKHSKNNNNLTNSVFM